MRKSLAVALALSLAAMAGSAFAAGYNGWVKAVVTVQPPAGQQAPPATEYYFSDATRQAAVITDAGGDRGVQFMAPNQGYMETYSSKKGELLRSELTKSAILPQDQALPDTFNEALEDAKRILNTDRPNDAVAMQGTWEVHTLTGPAAGPKVLLWVDGRSKLLGRVIQDSGQGAVTTINYEYLTRPVQSIFDLGVPRNARLVDNLPAPETRAFLDQLDARLEKDWGDNVAVLITDPQTEAQKNVMQHDARLPYTVEVFGRNGDAFVYRVHSLQTAPAGALEQILGSVQNLPASTYMIYDGRTLYQLTYDPQTGKPLPTSKEVKLTPKDFSPSNFPRRVFLGRDGLGTAVPVAKTKLLEDPRKFPGLKGVMVTRPTSLVYQGQNNQPANVQADQWTVYWVDPNKGYAPALFWEGRYPPKDSGLRPEVMETKFANYTTAPDGTAVPTRWQTGTWDVQGGKQSTDFSLLVAWNRRIDRAWLTPPMPLPQAPGAGQGGR